MENTHISTVNQSKPTAIIYCEANFGKVDGKTANGLVRHSQNYRVLSVIDSQQAGLDSGVVLGGEVNEIPIVSNLGEAFAIADETPDYFIFGLAPSSGMLSEFEKKYYSRSNGAKDEYRKRTARIFQRRSSIGSSE